MAWRVDSLCPSFHFYRMDSRIRIEGKQWKIQNLSRNFRVSDGFHPKHIFSLGLVLIEIERNNRIFRFNRFFEVTASSAISTRIIVELSTKIINRNFAVLYFPFFSHILFAIQFSFKILNSIKFFKYFSDIFQIGRSKER